MKYLHKAAIIAGALAIVAGCGDDSSSAKDRDREPYVAAMAANLGDGDNSSMALSETESQCAAEAIFDHLPVSLWKDADIEADEIEDLGRSPGEALGDRMPEGAADEIAGDWADCFDLASLITDQVRGRLPEAAADCFQDRITHDGLDRKYFAVVISASRTDVSKAAEEMFGPLTTECLQDNLTPESTAKLLAENLTTSMAQAGIPEATAKCVAGGAIDRIGPEQLDRWLRQYPEFQSLPAEISQQVQTALEAAASSCGLDPSTLR